MSAWYNGPFWPSNLWNWCGRTLLSSESRTNIWTKLHCCFLGHAGLLLDAKRWPSSASCFKPCFVMLLLFTNYCHAATWSLTSLSKTGLQIPACVNHLQALFSDVHPPAAGTAVHRGTSLHSHWRALVTRGGLHWFCINFWESYAQFIRRRKKKKANFPVQAMKECQNQPDFTAVSRFPLVPQQHSWEPPGLSSSAGCTDQNQTHLLFSGCASDAPQMGIKQHIFLLSSVKAIVKAYLKRGLNTHVLPFWGEYTICGWM